MTSRRAIAAALVGSAALFIGGCGGVAPFRTPFNRGVHLASTGDLDGAVREFREALSDDPSDYRARFNLAATLEEIAGVRDAAAKVALSERRTDDADAAAEAARAARGEARRHYERILADRPTDVRASCNLAALLFERADAGEDPEAEAAAFALLDRCASASPGDALPARARASRYFRRGELDLAEKEARRALAAESADPETHFLLGEIALRRGDCGAACERFRRVLVTLPDDVAALLAIGRAETASARAAEAEGRMNDASKARDEAIVHYRRAAMIRRDSYEAHAALADLEEKAGDDEAAVAHLLSARRLDDRRRDGERPDYETRLASLYERLAAKAKAAAERRSSAPF